MHNRLIELELFAINIKKLKEHFGIEVYLTTSDKTASVRARKHGFKVNYYPQNRPFGAKRNVAMRFASKCTEAEMFISCAEDHLFNAEFIGYNLDKIREGYEFTGTLDGYFYDYKKKMAVYQGGYSGWRKDEPHGMGRCYSPELLKRMEYIVVDDGEIGGMDLSNWRHVRWFTDKIHTYSLGEDKMIVDLKNGESMNTIESCLGQGKAVHPSEIFSKLEKGTFVK